MYKVLYVFGGEKASGAEIVIERLMTFNTNFVQPHLFVSPGRFAEELIAADKPYPVVTIDRLRKLNRSSTSAIKFFIEALKNYLLVSLKVVRYVHKNQITHIHANTVVPASYLIPAILYAKLFNKKKVWIWSDHDLKYFSKLDNVFSTLCSILFDKTLVVSKAVKNKYGAKKKVFLLYNGLDLNQYKSNVLYRDSFRSKLNLTDKIVLGIAATISPRKGQLELIRVFSNLLEEFNNIALVIAGGLGKDNEDYNSEVLNLIKDNNSIHYVGHINNMVEFYCGCDIIINNSSKSGSEPLGTTIYEAMACEKVVIASNTGGTSEIITDKVDGFIFEADSNEGLFQCLVQTLSNFSQLADLRTSARKKVERIFSLENMSSNYNRLISIK